MTDMKVRISLPSGEEGQSEFYLLFIYLCQAEFALQVNRNVKIQSV